MHGDGVGLYLVLLAITITLSRMAHLVGAVCFLFFFLNSNGMGGELPGLGPPFTCRLYA
jgi:hypothetical protein